MDITATKEILWRHAADEYGVVHVTKVTRITDDEGDVTDKLWRRAISPDDDIADLPAELQASIAAARTPDAVARFEARKVDTPVLP